MDARVARTRRRLQEALFGLARERSIDEVTVGGIAERAGVNRSTFYQHYRDKETLLADALDNIAEHAGADLGVIDPHSLEPPDAVVRFLSHIEQHAGVYRRVFSEPGYAVAYTRLHRRIHDAVRELADSRPDEVDLEMPTAVIAAGFAGTVTGVIGAWLDQDPPASAEVAARWVWLLVVGAAVNDPSQSGARPAWSLREHPATAVSHPVD